MSASDLPHSHPPSPPVSTAADARVSIPALATAVPAASSSRRMWSMPAPRGPTQVLLVDDSPSLLAQMCDLLSERGFEVTGVNDGAEALALLKCRSFDVVVSDLHMP
ncbi:MAG: response regulator, partial [Myxococcales bacterium]|nr:response regulator [Myxococcales bacterium]